MKTYLYSGKPVETRSAAGTRGVLIRTFDGEIRFRVYQGNDQFTDYEIRHDDLSVTIDEKELAAFYHVEGQHILDHGPGVLGLEQVRD